MQVCINNLYHPLFTIAFPQHKQSQKLLILVRAETHHLALDYDTSKLSCTVISSLVHVITVVIKGKSHERRAWRYKLADFETTNAMLDSLDFRMVVSISVGAPVMEKCMPQVILSDKLKPQLNIELAKSTQA